MGRSKWFCTIRSDIAVSDIRESEVPIQIVRREQKNIFEHIYGHNSLKTIFYNALTSEQPIHILLTGAPGTAKTLFLEAVGNNVPNASFITSNSTGPGILRHLYENKKLRYLCIDEIEKIPRDQLAVLLTLMDSGRLIVTKKTMMVNRLQEVTIFATCNRVDRLAPEMQSRFLKFHLKEYNFSEFNLVTRNIATKKFNQSIEFAEKIADSVWNKMNSKDIRDCIKLMRLCKNIDQIDIIIEGLKEYGKNKDE